MKIIEENFCVHDVQHRFNKRKLKIIVTLKQSEETKMIEECVQ